MGHLTVADVKTEIAESGRAVVVVGTGVSLAAMDGTATARLASWDGLLRHGIDHCTRFGGRDEAWAISVRSRPEAPETEAFLGVAGEVCGALAAPGLGELGRWLQETVGSFRPDHQEELRGASRPAAAACHDQLRRLAGRGHGPARRHLEGHSGDRGPAPRQAAAGYPGPPRLLGSVPTR